MKRLVILKYIIIIVIFFLLHIVFMNPPKRIYRLNIIGTIQKKILIEDFSSGLNKEYWNIVERGNNYNNELQYYSSNNINVKDGILDIEARKEEYKGHHYTSGMIDTKNKFEFLYGKIIFKAKPAIGKGMLSAIWLLPADDSPFPEIDIVEILGTSDDQIWTGIHYLDSDLKKKSYFVWITSNKDYYTYELDWEENEIRCYINNRLTYKTNTGVSNKKMYLIINLSVGGNWPKDPDDNILPAHFLLDYIIIVPEELNTT